MIKFKPTNLVLFGHKVCTMTRKDKSIEQFCVCKAIIIDEQKMIKFI